MRIRLGTRQSPLARWQATHIAALLEKLDVAVELVPIVTEGDVSTLPLGQSGGVGLFTKEIQRALLDRRCDLAVHSLKDLPTEPVDGLTLAGVPPREDVRDCLISRGHVAWNELPHAARIGTGSLRRASQLRRLRPDLQILEIRGNVDSRLKKLDNGDYDAIVLAAAGIKRLQLEDRITSRFGLDDMLPAVGQGALGLETRADDCSIIDLIERISHLETHQAVLAERAMLRALRGGCLAPIASLAVVEGGRITLRGRALATDGSVAVETTVAGKIDQAIPVGLQAARQLQIGGAERLIEMARDGLSAAKRSG